MLDIRSVRSGSSFIGGYVQAVLRPLSLPLSIALAVPHIVSVTEIPLFAPLILKAKKTDWKGQCTAFDRCSLFVSAPDGALAHKALRPFGGLRETLKGVYIFPRKAI